ncbi:MAG: hypothetical protein AAFN93_26070 [Bacteroidota bacterium]
MSKKWRDSMQLSDYIAFLALIISIIGLWMQDRGARQQLLVANISEYTKRYQDIFEKLPKSLLDENFNLATLTEDEQEPILRYVWLYFDLCYEQYLIHHDLKLVNMKVWKLWEAGMKATFSRPSFQQCWMVINANSFYPGKFARFVDKLICSQSQPKSNRTSKS